MKDFHKSIISLIPGIKSKKFTVFDDMIAGMVNDKKLKPVVTELFVRGRKLNCFYYKSRFYG